mmetsp:Transcript_53892/g.100982  ORF Transcript_53892/g.100982 Transcript_53892/m.100982 type:complete len:237 (-) Transcript_53892:102-812(-)
MAAGPSLLKVLTDQDLLTSALVFLTPGCLVRLGRVCGPLQCVNQGRVSALLGEGVEASRWREPALLPQAERGEKWSLERLHLCYEPPRFPLIHFSFANDELDARARDDLEEVAEVCKRHPSLQLLVRGYARPEAPPDLGVALSQARAARVRSYLLRLLKDFGWDEDPSEGIRDGGYDEGRRDLDEMLGFYCTRVVGQRIKAVGCWSEGDLAPRLAYLGSCGGQSAEILIHGFHKVA